MKRSISLFAILSLVLTACGTNSGQESSQEKSYDGPFGLSSPIQNVQGRQTLSLDGDWKAFVDQYETGYYDYRHNIMPDENTFFADKSFADDKTKLIEYDFNTASTLKVPSDWNTQRKELYYYEGTIWYRQKFQAAPKEGKRQFLHFGAANYEAVVGVNGKPIARHIGGYTPFNVEVTDLLKQGENSVIVKVDNKRRLEGVPTVNSDWWNYGGITRSVNLVEVPATFIRDYCIQADENQDKDGFRKDEPTLIRGWVQLDGKYKGEKVRLSIPELSVELETTPDAGGMATFSFRAPALRWSPKQPKLYDVTISSNEDSISDRIGFRTISTRGSEVLLNGEKVFLKGISIHEESPEASKGRFCSEQEARTLLGWAKELGCNFVRLAHYPHNENMVRMAEEMGIMVWDEIPVYWTIDWNNEDTYLNAETQLGEMISRDHNRAAVIVWSVANETPRKSERLEFLRKLMEKARSLDGTRLVSAAMEKDYLDSTTVTVEDELLEFADVISFNQYIGWYDGDSDKCDAVKWVFPVDKPVIVTELGGGAKAGLHGSESERFTEEYQRKLYEKNMAMLDRIDALAGVTPWILKDFRSPRRFLPDIQDDYNRKGLLSEKGERKQAFYTYRDWSYRADSKSEE